MSKTPTRESNSENKDHPKSTGIAAFVEAIIIFLLAMGGPQLFTTYAPPTANVATIRLMLVGVAAAAWLVAYLLARSWWRNESAKLKIIRRFLAACFFVFALSCTGTLYMNAWEQFTIPFNNERVLIGTQLTKAGQAYFAKNPGASAFEAVWAAGGRADDVWTAESISATRDALVNHFTATIFCGVLCVILLYYTVRFTLNEDIQQSEVADAVAERELMNRAISELEKCNPLNPQEIPKVGAVIAIDGTVIAAACRGEHDHAEMLALTSVPAADLSRATLFTTLEPCTPGVRRREGHSCTEWIIRRQVKRVVIGILDPNQGVCGKGVLQLQAAGIEVSLFPDELASRIRRLNDEFIQAQQGLGLRITSPPHGSEFRGNSCRVTGTYKNPPGSNVVAITYVGGFWWPQPAPVRRLPETDNQWEVMIDIGLAEPHKIYIVKANPLGMELINYYRKMIVVRHQFVTEVSARFDLDPEQVRNIAPLFWPLTMATLPKGLDEEAFVEINVTSLRGLERLA